MLSFIKHKNNLPKPKYLATEISISIASSRIFVKTMVTLGNQVGSNPGKCIVRNLDKDVCNSVQLYECTKVIQYRKQYQYSVSVQATMGPHRNSDNP